MTIAETFVLSLKTTLEVTPPTLPASYTFGADDYGYHVFMVTFGTKGSQTVTATDAADNFTASATIDVLTLTVLPPGGDPVWQAYQDLFKNYGGPPVPPVAITPPALPPA